MELTSSFPFSPSPFLSSHPSLPPFSPLLYLFSISLWSDISLHLFFDYAFLQALGSVYLGCVWVTGVFIYVVGYCSSWVFCIGFLWLYRILNPGSGVVFSNLMSDIQEILFLSVSLSCGQKTKEKDAAICKYINLFFIQPVFIWTWISFMYIFRSIVVSWRDLLLLLPRSDRLLNDACVHALLSCVWSVHLDVLQIATLHTSCTYAHGHTWLVITSLEEGLIYGVLCTSLPLPLPLSPKGRSSLNISSRTRFHLSYLRIYPLREDVYQSRPYIHTLRPSDPPSQAIFRDKVIKHPSAYRFVRSVRSGFHRDEYFSVTPFPDRYVYVEHRMLDYHHRHHHHLSSTHSTYKCGVCIRANNS